MCQGADNFTSQTLNTGLKHLGEGVGNITRALDGLKAKTPALVIQLRKTGKTRQGRKLYKVTNAGIKAVEAMISG